MEFFRFCQRLVFVSCVLTVSHPCTSRALAQTDPTEEATALHERGIVAFGQGKYREAVTAFLAADRLWPDPSLSYNLGRAYDQLHDDAHALAQYREYLRRAPQAPDRKEVAAKIDALAQRVGPLVLQFVRLDATPQGANVWIDDEPIGPVPVELQLPPGAHRARFQLEGYGDREVSFEVAASGPVPEIRASLRANHAPSTSTDDSGLPALSSEEAAAFAPNLSKAPRVDSAKTPLLRHVGVAALIAGVASFGAAIAFEIVRADAAQTAGREREQIRFASALDAMESRQTWARVFLATGGVLATAGITMLVLSRDKDSEQTALSVDCGPQRCGAALLGTF